MPGPGGRNKRKTKATVNGKARRNINENVAQATFRPAMDAFPLQCRTLMEDEITRCGQLATEGQPKQERCKVHHGQYCIMYKKYKDASKVADDVRDSAELPTKDQIGRYTDWHAALEKVHCVRKYLEAIRIENAGWYIHYRRFFLEGECRCGCEVVVLTWNIGSLVLLFSE